MLHSRAPPTVIPLYPHALGYYSQHPLQYLTLYWAEFSKPPAKLPVAQGRSPSQMRFPVTFVHLDLHADLHVLRLHEPSRDI
jgi:hypothetical protein